MSNQNRRLDDWKTRLARPASLMVLDVFAHHETIGASWFGRVTLQKPGESWPQSDGRPMWPLCQIIVDELPFVPDSLRDLALVRIYVDPDFHHCNTDSGEGWCVRVSHSLDGMIETQPPDHGSNIKPRRARWQLIDEDYPCSEDLPDDFPDELVEIWMDCCPTSDGTKLGGWPQLIQSEISWFPGNKHPANPEYAIQIDSSEKCGWQWGDAGVGYFGRGTGEHRDIWAMEWQCM